MLMTLEGQWLGSHCSPPCVAHREAEVEVGVAVEPETRVEPSDRPKRLAPEREAVRLDRVDLTGRCVLELAPVDADHAPSAGDTDGRVVEGSEQRRQEVSRRLERGVQQHGDLARRVAHARRSRICPAQSPLGLDDSRLDREPGRAQHVAHCIARAVRDDDELPVDVRRMLGQPLDGRSSGAPSEASVAARIGRALVAPGPSSACQPRS
jgi:hypothetical protein